MDLKEKARIALESWGASESEIQEELAKSNEKILAEYVKQYEAEQRQKTKPKERAKPTQHVKKKVEFDPVAAAMDIIADKAELIATEIEPTLKYAITPVYLLKIVTESSEDVMKAVDDYIKLKGGIYVEHLHGYIFTINPETVL